MASSSSVRRAFQTLGVKGNHGPRQLGPNLCEPRSTALLSAARGGSARVERLRPVPLPPLSAGPPRATTRFWTRAGKHVTRGARDRAERVKGVRGRRRLSADSMNFLPEPQGTGRCGPRGRTRSRDMTWRRSSLRLRRRRSIEPPRPPVAGAAAPAPAARSRRRPRPTRARRRGRRCRAVALGGGSELLLLGLLLDLDAEEIEDDLLLDRRGQLLEHRVALRAVLGRVLLGHGTSGLVAEVLHRLEVLAPAHVHDLEDE